MNLDATLEAVLFAAAQPLSLKKLASITEQNAAEVAEALDALRVRLEQSSSGIRLIFQGENAELVTHPDAAEFVQKTIHQEIQGELTKPQLEALSILAYRGPLTRPELEQIRGVQSSMILRNLMLRGLVEMHEETRLGQPVYAVTIDFLKCIGASHPSELPDYESLRTHSAVVQVLDELQPEKESSAAPDDESLNV